MSKGPHPFVRLIVYPALAILFFIVCYFIALMASGYKFEYKNGQIIKRPTGMVVVATKPGKAKVYIDGKIQKRSTPSLGFLTMTVKGVSVGEHGLKVEKDGYETFNGIFLVEPKLVTWANYLILVPKERKASNFGLPGDVVGTISTENKQKIIAQVEDKETNLRTFWQINLQTKEKVKIKEDKIIENEKTQLLSTNGDASRVLIKKTLGEVSSYIVMDNKPASENWNIDILYKITFDSLKFDSGNNTALYGLKDKNLYKLDYENRNMSAVLASEVVDFYTNNADIYLIKETNNNTGLWRLSDNESLTSVVKVLPASDSYKFKHLKNRDTFLILPNKDKELLLYDKDANGNSRSKSIAQNVNNFTLSPKEERILLIGEDNVRTFDIKKEMYYETIKNTKIESIVWFNDDSNIIYSSDGRINTITFLGHYNNPIFKNIKNTPVYAMESSANIYFQDEYKKQKSLFVYSFNF